MQENGDSDVQIYQNGSSMKSESSLLTLSKFIYDNSRHFANKASLIKCIRKLFHQSQIKISQQWTIQKITYRIAIMVISIISHTKQQNKSSFAQNTKLFKNRQIKQQKFNNEEIQDSFIKISDAYLYVSAHFIQYFCFGNYGSIISKNRIIRQNFHYQNKQKGEVTQIVPISSFIQQLVNFKYRFSCFCLNSKNSLQKPYQTSILRCQKCMNLFHGTCQQNLILCGRCYLFELCLQSRPVQQIALFYLQPKPLISFITFKLPNINQEKNIVAKKHRYQIRIHRMMKDKIIQEEMKQFFKNYSLTLNHQILTKKQKTISTLTHYPNIKVPYHYLEEENILIIKKKNKLNRNGQFPSLQMYIIGIFKCENIKPKPQFINQINQTQSLNLLRSIKNRELIPEKITLTDIKTNRRISMPVRGFNCTHFQCFDWKEFYHQHFEKANKKLSIIKRNFKKDQKRETITNQKKQKQEKRQVLEEKKRFLRKIKRENIKKCPICQQNLYNVYIDPIYSKILTKFSSDLTDKQIQIFQNGTYIVKTFIKKIEVIEIN